MPIAVKFVGAFRHFSGTGKLELNCRSQTSVAELVTEIVRELPQIECVLIDSQLENPRPNALILVNRREIDVLDGLETELKDGDEVVLIPIVHGG